MNELRNAIKNNVAVEVEMDVYLLEDGRIVKYDRYVKGNCKWICDDGYAYRNFFEVLHKERYFVKKHNIKF